MPELRPLPTELLHLANAQHGALAGAQLRSVLSERGLRRAVHEGQLIKLWQGAYCLPWAAAPALNNASPNNAAPNNAAPNNAALNNAAPNNAAPAASTSRRGSIPCLTRLAAAELTLGRPVAACLDSAAELYGFATDLDSRTHVIGAAPSLRGQLAVHRTPPLTPTNRVHGFEVVGVAETAVRLAALADHAPRGLAVLDAELRTNYTSSALLSDTARHLQVTNVGRVRSLIAIADRRAESPPESWLRWVCHDAGFPPPVPQFWVHCPNGSWFRLDLAWPSIKLGLEYDGVGVHTGVALTRDRKRLSALNRAGWTIRSVTAPMLWAGREELVTDLRADLLLYGAA